MIRTISLIYAIVSCLMVSVSIAADSSEIDKKIEEIFSGKENISEEQKNQMKLQVLSIMATKNKFDYRAIKKICKEDLDRFCSTKDNVTEILECIKANRNQVSQICEDSLKNTFGGKSFPEDRMHAGVMLPKGSYFFYNPRGDILGAVASENFTYNGIEFKKGQVRFHETGLSVAHLTKDQDINGVKYKADGLGPFFDKNGNVENATLAEDTNVSGVFYKQNTQIMFNSDRTVQLGRLAKDASIDGKTYKAGSQLSFQANGTIKVFK